MKQTSGHDPIKRLLTEGARGVPLGLADLDAMGVSAQLASKYAKEGWLVRLGHGVYAFPNDELEPHRMVWFLQERVEGLHVGGRSALALP